MGEIARVLKRRWPLAAAAALLAVAAALGAFLIIGPTYKFTSAVLLLPPKISSSADDVTRGNPLFYLGSLTQARDLILGEMNSKNVQDQVKEQYPATTYGADRDVLGSSPVVVITVEGADEATARQLSRHLTDVVPETLASLQDRLDIRENARIGSAALTIDDIPEKRNRSQLRAAIVAGGAVAALGTALIVLLDSVLTTRKSRSQPEDVRPRGGSTVTPVPNWAPDPVAPRRASTSNRKTAARAEESDSLTTPEMATLRRR